MVTLLLDKGADINHADKVSQCVVSVCKCESDCNRYCEKVTVVLTVIMHNVIKSYVLPNISMVGQLLLPLLVAVMPLW